MDRTRKQYTKNDYVEDSMARQLYAVPEYEEDYDFGEPVRRQAPKRHVRRKPKPQNLDWASILFLTAAVCTAMLVCVSYLQLQADIEGAGKKTVALEREIMTLKSENAAARDQIDESVDLAYVYRVATKELGMVHADKNQIVTFEGTKSDFLRQYGEIPEGKKE